MNITVRDLNEEVFRKFKGKAAERGMKMGVAVAHAMRLFLENEVMESKKQIPKQSKWSRDSTSKEIDSLLYGE
ncbi:MAG: hypothetical protein KGH94_03335 [Candidatus Micrarchaeota archaeon]|nr:hypothetical protein [Candidatus Micrarchaeota archaeon]